MGRKIIEEINRYKMNTLDGASVQLPGKKVSITGTGTGESGTPSTPSEEVPSGDLTGGSDTGSGSETGETGSGETGSGEPSKTYSDYVAEGYEGQKGIINSNYKSYEQFWNGYLANAKATNAQEREAAEQRAETERQRGVIDGQASYDFNKATYGKQAEALRSMGLSGSGYADYLTSRAYATQRAEVQGANAQAATAKREAREAEARANATAEEAANKGIFDATVARDTALADAETTYLEGMLEFEKNKDTTYKTLIEAAASGTYSSEVLTRMAKEAGLDEDQITDITTAATTAKDKSAQDEYIKLLGLAAEGKYSDDLLKEIAAARGLDETAISEILKIAGEARDKVSNKAQNALYSQYSADIDNGVENASVIEAAFENGEITPDQWNSLQEQYSNDLYYTFKDFKKEDGSDMTYEEAGAVINDLFDRLHQNPLFKTDVYNKLAKIFNEKYVYTNNTTNNTTKGKVGAQDVLNAATSSMNTPDSPAGQAGAWFGDYLAGLILGK